MVDIFPFDDIVYFGDSKGRGGFGFVELLPAMLAIRNTYRGPTPPAVPPRTGVFTVPSFASYDRGNPRWHNLSLDGQTTNSLVARTAEIVAINPQVCIIGIETNDADPAFLVSNATFTSNINTAIAAIRTGSRLRTNGILWIQATCRGEKFPFGSNVDDLTATGLGAKDDILRQRAAALNFEVVEGRTDSTAIGGGNGPWLTYEQTFNLGNVDAPFANSLTQDGKHDTQAGTVWTSNLALAHIRLNG